MSNLESVESTPLRATNCSLSSITEHSFQGIAYLPLSGEEVLPMCPVQPVTYVSGRSFPRGAPPNAGSSSCFNRQNRPASSCGPVWCRQAPTDSKPPRHTAAPQPSPEAPDSVAAGDYLILIVTVIKNGCAVRLARLDAGRWRGPLPVQLARSTRGHL